MLNSVGLQNPGVEAWLADELPALVATGARVVASIWGTTVAGYEKAAAALAAAPDAVVAVEVNLSCPNLEGGRHMFATDPSATREAIAAVAAACGPAACGPSSAPTSPTSSRSPAPPAAGGAEALTLVNTVKGMAIDPVSRRPRLGAGGGGLSGAAIRPVAVRAVYDVPPGPSRPAPRGRGRAWPPASTRSSCCWPGRRPSRWARPRSRTPGRRVRVLRRVWSAWCRRHRVARVADLVGQAHGAP